MKKQFVTLEIANMLKAIGYNEPCLAGFRNGKSDALVLFGDLIEGYTNSDMLKTICAPLWQQVIDWLMDKHSIKIHYIYSPKMNEWGWECLDRGYSQDYGIFYKTKEESILKALELVINSILNKNS